jgi:phosphotransferase system enzyme I (PtsI)
MANLSDAQPAIVDATTGRLILNPDPQTVASYQHLIRDLDRSREFYSCLDNLSAQTRSNRNILLKVNVELPEELAALENIQYDGIGLYRTEFIYLSRHSLPTQAEQYAIYKAILISMQGKPVTIRTFDLGGDKLPGYSHHYHEDNPNLGCRGIRFSLYQEAMFKAQLKAILQASVYGKVNIMFPMIIGLDDLLQAKTMLRLCQQELDSDHIPYDKDIRVGIMIETPSAAICSDVLATACDFFSIGTNDLVQYTLAVDRNNERVSAYYNQAHPAVLQLIKKTIQAAKQAGIAVSVCGEMASEPLYVPLLIGLGIDELSVNPVSLPLVKAIIRSCDTELDSEVQNFDFSVPAPQISAWLKALEQRYFPKP